MRPLEPLSVVVPLLVIGCGEPRPVVTPPATPVVAVEPSPPAPAPTSVPANPNEHVCRCDILDFEHDGPPTSTCELTFADDGSATLKSLTAQPPFSAAMRPHDHYGFEATFELDCPEPWCGRQELIVHEVRALDYRVTVARSDEGPPSHVLWIICDAPGSSTR